MLPDSLREPGVGQAPPQTLWRPSCACSALNPSLGCPPTQWAVPAPLGLESRSTPLSAHFQQAFPTAAREEVHDPWVWSEQWLRGGVQAGSSWEDASWPTGCRPVWHGDVENGPGSQCTG